MTNQSFAPDDRDRIWGSMKEPGTHVIVSLFLRRTPKYCFAYPTLESNDLDHQEDSNCEGKLVLRIRNNTLGKDY
uniref:Uncharacterized protein n=1 Tax=Trichonephila clavata TaxID=2740835 RepID=A0A8X6KLM6_TRICU|nr:hypothetical protein TNCT_505291 [Trichonephila clavata]